jgi:hypothetical protein
MKSSKDESGFMNQSYCLESKGGLMVRCKGNPGNGRHGFGRSKAQPKDIRAKIPLATINQFKARSQTVPTECDELGQTNGSFLVENSRLRQKFANEQNFTGYRFRTSIIQNQKVVENLKPIDNLGQVLLT